MVLTVLSGSSLVIYWFLADSQHEVPSPTHPDTSWVGEHKDIQPPFRIRNGCVHFLGRHTFLQVVA